MSKRIEATTLLCGDGFSGWSVDVTGAIMSREPALIPYLCLIDEKHLSLAAVDEYVPPTPHPPTLFSFFLFLSLSLLWRKAAASEAWGVVYHPTGSSYSG